MSAHRGVGKPIRWAVSGTGAIARRTIGFLRSSRGCSVAAVVSRDSERARAFVREHALSDAVGCTAEALGGGGGARLVDAVYVTAPNHLHLSWCVRLARLGLHVLCEKPLVCRAWEAERIADEAARAGVLVVEAFKHLHHAQTDRLAWYARRSMEDPDGSVIGGLRFLRCERSWDLRRAGPYETRFSAAMQGGALMDLGCYCVSLLRELAGSEPETARAVASVAPALSGEAGGVDGTLSFQATFPRLGGGRPVPADGFTSIETRAGGTRVEVIGSRGVVRTGWPFTPDPARGVLEVETWAERDSEVVERFEDVIADGGECFVNQFEAFAAAVRGVVEAKPSPAWSIAQARVVERLLSSAGVELGASPEP